MIILLFENVHRVMQAEKALLAAGVFHELIPTPRKYSSECGMSIEIREAAMPAATTVLEGIAHRAVG